MGHISLEQMINIRKKAKAPEKVKRTTYSDYQKKVMTNYFDSGHRYLNSVQRKEIAIELGLR